MIGRELEGRFHFFKWEFAFDQIPGRRLFRCTFQKRNGCLEILGAVVMHTFDADQTSDNLLGGQLHGSSWENGSDQNELSANSQ
jgi:hypothetical protein